MKCSSIAAAFVLSYAAASVAHAQKTFASNSGTLFRYFGDTIWVDRDTTETRVVYRGDTVIRRFSMNGRMRSEMTTVLRDGAAWTISTVDSTGTARPIPNQLRSTPLMIATAERDMLARELQMQETMDRASRRVVDAMYFQMMPPSPMTYAVAPATTMVHVRDTVLYIRGCPGAARLDTTVFQLFGDDSTRRLSAPARTFGKAMALSLISQMRLRAIQDRMASQAPSRPRDIPGMSSGACNRPGSI